VINSVDDRPSDEGSRGSPVALTRNSGGGFGQGNVPRDPLDVLTDRYAVLERHEFSGRLLRTTPLDRDNTWRSSRPG